jgi:pyrroline-5-carboxylate reductase
VSEARPGGEDGGGPVGCLFLVGCGKMGSAMLRGWLAATVASRCVVIEPAGMPAKLGSAAEIVWYPSPDELPPELRPDAVVFAVKPQIADTVVPNYRRWARSGTLFVSIIAGKTLAGLSRHLGRAAIVRTMPNTPAAIGRGITVACANPLVTIEQRRLCDRLIAAIGESAWVEDERLMDAVTAVSGSGPAYVFLLIEALARAGQSEGLPADLALRLALATVAGSGELARTSAESPGQLRENVTSPGGTTRAALDVLMAADGLEPLVERAVAAAAARSRELAS